MIVLFPSLVEEFHTYRDNFKISFKKAFTVYFVVGSSIALVFFGFSNEIIGSIYGDNFLFSVEIFEILAIVIALSFLIFFVIKYSHHFRLGDEQYLEFDRCNNF